MRAVKFCALAALLVAYASAAPEYVKDFESFKTRFNRKYPSPAEEARKFKNFVANMKKAAELQAVNPHATFGANEFADMSEHDFKTRHNGEKAFREARKVAAGLETLKMSAEQIAAAAGQSQDWRPKGAVTPVKNQGQCGSCWSFSTTGGIEGQWFLAGNSLTSLSEQELVSCDTIDSGCNGGLMDNAFEWLINNKNGSIVTEASYPYVSGDGIVPACDLSGKQFGARIESYKNIASSETEMGSFVYTSGPLSIAVDAESWQTYTGGVMTNCPAGQLDHGVLIVGFDDSASPAYWIIKNSWGASWGESGYIRVQKGTGQCSIGQYQTTSIVKKSGPTPPPAPTPAPAGPTAPPSPSTTQFVQKTCLDNKCSSECSEQSFPAGQCVNRGGKSFKSTCATDAVIVAVYASENCAGEAVVTSNPLDTCSIVFEKTGGEHFVENECRSGSNPPSPPSPPSPPAPTPAPTSSATFEQKQCSDSACSQGCTSHTFPQNSCLTLSGGGSATAVCTATELQMTVYPTSNTCSGMSESSSQPINQCLQDQQGTYFENICNNGNAAGKTIEHSNFKGVFPKRA